MRSPPTPTSHSAVDLFMGAYHAHYLSGDPFPDRWEERIVDSLLRGLGAPAA